MSQPINIWRFKDAPEEYKGLKPATQAGHWVALIPPSLATQDGIIETVSGYWPDSVQVDEDDDAAVFYEVATHQNEDGSIVLVGSYVFLATEEE